MAGGIGAIITSVLIFAVPDIGMQGKIVYSFILYFLGTVVFSTMSSISNAALNNLITRDANERVRLGSTSFVVYFLTIIFVSFGLNVTDSLGGGQKGWVNLSIIMGFVAIVLLVIVWFGVHERVAINTAEKIKLKDIGYALTHNKYFFFTMMIYMGINIYNAMVINVSVYYSMHVLNSMTSFTILTIASYAPTIVGTAITPALARKLGNGKVVLAGNVLTIIGYLLIAVRPRDIVWVAIFIGVGGFGSGAISANINPFNAMSADYGEYKNGKAMPGVYSGAASFGTKIGSAIGGAVCGFILAAAGYNGLAEVQTVAAQNAIIGCYALSPGLVTIVILLFCLPFFKLEKEYPEIRKALDKKAASAEEK